MTKLTMAFVHHVVYLTSPFTTLKARIGLLTHSHLHGLKPSCLHRYPTMVSNPNTGPKTRAELAALYGGAYLGTSIALSTISFLMWYAAVSVGVDVRQLLDVLGDWLETTPLGRPGALDGISNEVGAFALAYIAHKVTSPFRFPLTVAATPVVARMVGRRKTEKNKVEDKAKSSAEKKT